MKNSYLISLSAHIFRLLIHLYPASFRREFGQELYLTYRDYSQRVARREGLPGFLRIWLTTYIDLLATAFVERLKEITHMSPDKITRLLGAVGASGGFYLLGSSLAGLKDNAFFNIPSFLIPLYAIAILLGVIGLFLFADTLTAAAKASTGIAFAGAAVMATGLILMHWVNVDGGWGMWRIGELINAFGLLLFGLTVQGLPSHWKAAAIAMGFFSVLFFSIAAFISGTILIVSLFYFTLGLGWLLLGIMVITGTRSQPTDPHPAVGT